MVEESGTILHARWMGAMIYILKMILVGDDLYYMGATQQHGATDLAFSLYIPALAVFLTVFFFF